MPLKLRQATEEDENVLGRLVQLYLHDSSKYSHQTVDDNGLFSGLDARSLVGDGPCRAYLFHLAGRLAGFAVVKDLGDQRHMTDFFVLWPFRRLGVGEEVARLIFSEHPGAWSVPYNENNEVARAFWRAVVYRYSRKDFAEVRDKAGHLALRFESVPRPDQIDVPGPAPRFRTELRTESP
ncbi:MAG: hypothetical protein KF857_10290 [Fimbriimonadaceae bacterium]|nr:hypothetical protein [Fimbriimonadaceae bacterium]